ncbi:MAG: metalloregulator ArsR/SmtB family transcription factor [Gemmatimonadales bacterium]
MKTRPSPADLLTAIAEPTRLRIVNCLAAAPLFVSDLQAILKLPQPTVSRHLRILRDAGVVHDTAIGQFVLYRLRSSTDVDGRLIAAVLESLAVDDTFGAERQRAADRNHTHTRSRAAEPVTA